MNLKAKEKACSLCAIQVQFLQQTETCLTWEIASLDLEDKTLRSSLCSILMNIPDPDDMTVKLFHSVNCMFKQDGYIFCFHPDQAQTAQEIVAGLLVFLKGIWSGLMDVEKFNKFFSATALDRAKEAWWDPTDRCVITKADRELELLMTVDKDMAFTPMTVQVDISQVAADPKVPTKRTNGLTASDSVSTFQTKATKASKAPATTQATSTQNGSHKPMEMSDAQTIATGLTGLTSADPDLKQLLIVLLQTLQNPPTPSLNSSTGSQKSGGQS